MSAIQRNLSQLAKMGDIRNNYEVLKQELKLVKYSKLSELEK